MKPVSQTKFGQEGNCLMACIASIFEVPLDSLPDLEAMKDRDWFRVMNATLETFGVKAFSVGNSKDRLAPSGYHIAVGQSPRDLQHAVVMLDGKLAHDPHPSRDGIRSVDYYLLIVPLLQDAAGVEGSP